MGTIPRTNVVDGQDSVALSGFQSVSAAFIPLQTRLLHRLSSSLSLH
jgi:hypothetical protein